MREKEQRGETGNERGGTERRRLPAPPGESGRPEEAGRTCKAAAWWPCLPAAFQSVRRRPSRYSREHAGGLKGGKRPIDEVSKVPSVSLPASPAVSDFRGLRGEGASQWERRWAGRRLVGFAPQGRVWKSRGPLKPQSTGRWEKEAE